MKKKKCCLRRCQEKHKMLHCSRRKWKTLFNAVNWKEKELKRGGNENKYKCKYKPLCTGNKHIAWCTENWKYLLVKPNGEKVSRWTGKQRNKSLEDRTENKSGESVKTCSKQQDTRRTDMKQNRKCFITYGRTVNITWRSKNREQNKLNVHRGTENTERWNSKHRTLSNGKKNMETVAKHVCWTAKKLKTNSVVFSRYLHSCFEEFISLYKYTFVFVFSWTPVRIESPFILSSSLPSSLCPSSFLSPPAFFHCFIKDSPTRGFTVASRR